MPPAPPGKKDLDPITHRPRNEYGLIHWLWCAAIVLVSLIGCFNALLHRIAEERASEAEYRRRLFEFESERRSSPDFFSEADRIRYRDAVIESGMYDAAEADAYTRELWRAEQLNRRADKSQGKGGLLSSRSPGVYSEPPASRSSPLLPQGDPPTFDFLETLTLEDADECARHPGPLSLNGLKTISPGVAEKLAGHDGPLSLDGLVVLDLQVADALANHNGILSLNGIQHLTHKPTKTAAALARHQGRLDMNGLKTISHEVAKVLSGARCEVNLLGIESLSVSAAELLSKCPDIRLPNNVR